MNAKRLFCLGGPHRDRTCDPLIKSQLLYHLSYRPKFERCKNTLFSEKIPEKSIGLIQSSPPAEWPCK